MLGSRRSDLLARDGTIRGTLSTMDGHAGTRGTSKRRTPWPSVLTATLVLAIVSSGCQPFRAGDPTTAASASGMPGGSGAPGASASPGQPSGSPTPTPGPSFVIHVVARGDTMTSIARRYETSPKSIGYWNRDRYPTLDPESPSYNPNRVQRGWRLRVLPGVVDEVPPESTSAPATARPRGSQPPGPTPRPDGSSLVVTNGARGGSLVALTFDLGGPWEPTADIVDWLIDHAIPATIFATGSAAVERQGGRRVMALAAAHPDLFLVGNRSWDDADLTLVDGAGIRDRLERTDAALEGSTGRSTKPWFRPPGGVQDASVREGAGHAGWLYTVMWDVDPQDSRPQSEGGPTAADIAARILSRAAGGSIVLMNLGSPETLDALPEIVDGLRSMGLEPALVSDLIAP